MSDTPITDRAIMCADGSWTYELREEMRDLERERDEARQAVAKLHDWLSVANNRLKECRDLYGDTYSWPVNNDDLDHIPTILKELNHLIP